MSTFRPFPSSKESNWAVSAFWLSSAFFKSIPCTRVCGLTGSLLRLLATLDTWLDIPCIAIILG